MHGSTLKEIEKNLPDPHEQIVDILGRLLWKALIHQFPRDMFRQYLSDGPTINLYPSHATRAYSYADNRTYRR